MADLSGQLTAAASSLGPDSLTAPTETDNLVSIPSLGGGKDFIMEASQASTHWVSSQDIQLISRSATVTNAFAGSAGAQYQDFQLTPANYICQNLVVEIDVATNSTSGGSTLVVAPYIFNRIEISNLGTGEILQTIFAEALHLSAATFFDTNDIAKLAQIMNMNTSFVSPSNISASSTATYLLPVFSNLFEISGGVFLQTLSQGFNIRVWFNGSSAVVSGSTPTLSNLVVYANGYVPQQQQLRTLLSARQNNDITVRFLDSRISTFQMTLVSGQAVQQQLQGVSGMVAFAWILLRSSLTGSGLYTYDVTPLLSTFSVRNAQNQPILATYEKSASFNRFYESLEYTGSLGVALPVYIAQHCENIDRAYRTGANSGFYWYDSNQRLQILGASGASTGTTVNVTYVTMQPALITLTKEGGIVLTRR